MDAHRRTSTLRRVAMTASLAALLLPVAPADAAKRKPAPKSPVITKVTPMKTQVGRTLTLKGKRFRKGKAKNSVGFKAKDHSVVFLRSALSTKKTLTVKLSDRLERVMSGPTKFKLRVLSKRFGKRYTSAKLSPTIAPRPVDPGEGEGEPGVVGAPPETTVPVADATCVAGPGDQDGDLLADRLEADTLGTSACVADSDGDGVPDGYEYRSAVDFNDDEYQQPSQTLPYPARLPYPNPLSPPDARDNAVDYDGDGLTLQEEYALWDTLTPQAGRTLEESGAAATPLTYSDGLQYSKVRRCGAGEASAQCGPNDAGRRVPSLAAADYDKWNDFRGWLAASGYETVYLHDQANWFDHGAGRFAYSILDVDRSGAVEPDETYPLDLDGDGWLSDDERDEDADGIPNTVEAKTFMRPDYWAGCYVEALYPVAFGGTGAVRADTDGDGIRDGADDQDLDDVPNMMELSRIDASGFNDAVGPCTVDPTIDVASLDRSGSYGRVNPFNPCLPDPTSRSCARYFPDTAPAPFDGSPNFLSLQ